MNRTLIISVFIEGMPLTNRTISLWLLLWIIASTAGVVLKCEFKTVGWVVGPHYSCSQANIVNTKNVTHLTKIKGEHELERNDTDVRGLEVEGGDVLRTMFKGIDVFFPNLVAILWQDGVLEELTAEDFEPFPNLAQLYFSGNKLCTLDGSLFVHTRQLKWINFGYNAIESVGRGLLDGLSSLYYANFRNNYCVDFIAQTRMQVETLSALLRTDCKATTETITPTSTTEDPGIKPEECSFSCVNQMTLMELRFLEKIRELELRIDEIAMSNKSFS